MARRRYEFHVCASGKYEPWNCTCDPWVGESVTTTDDRDVEPLVEALRAIDAKTGNVFSGVCMANFAKAHTQDIAIGVAREMRDGVQDLVRDALAQFEEGGEA